MRRRIILGIVLVLTLVAAVRLVSVRRNQLMNQRVLAVAVLPVATGSVVRGDFAGERVCYGMITSDRQATVRARVGGVVSEILHREGDRVVLDTPLLELDGTPADPLLGRLAAATAVDNLGRSIESLRLTVRNLAATLANDRMLHENDAVSTQQVEASENRHEEARVQLAALRSELAVQQAQLAQYTVTAPFAGVIGSVQVQLGDVIPAMQPLFRVEDPTYCRVVATVAAGDLPRLAVGTPAVLVHQEHRLQAVVGRVHPSAGPGGTGTVDILPAEPPFGLPLGMSIEVRLTVDRLAGVLLVPADAVLAGGARTRVHVVENDTIRVVPVTVLAQSGDVVAVTGELAPATVLVRGSDSLLMRLADGVRVASRGAAR